MGVFEANQWGKVVSLIEDLSTTYRCYYVDIGPVVGSGDKIWTIGLNTESTNTPLLLLHGLGSGVAMWCLNFDFLARTRPVYAIDILGFGRSSRPAFSNESNKAEQQFVTAIEEWRKEMKLDKMIIVGHNMGGFLAAAYAIKHAERVEHLILADPWGFFEKPSDMRRNSAPFWSQLISFLFAPLNPLFLIRAAGPFGQWLIGKIRPDLIKRYSQLLKNDSGRIAQYLYQCNVQPPTGEAAFRCMAAGAGWAKSPILSRIDVIDVKIPITLLYGSRSWVDTGTDEKMRAKRGDGSYVNVKMVAGAGMNMYADKSDIFNKFVEEACLYSDSLK